MSIELPYLLVALGGISVGLLLGWYFGIRLYELKRIRRILKIKNPEFWDLEHFSIVDQEREETARRENWVPERDGTEALEPMRQRFRLSKSRTSAPSPAKPEE